MELRPTFVIFPESNNFCSANFCKVGSKLIVMKSMLYYMIILKFSSINGIMLNYRIFITRKPECKLNLLIKTPFRLKFFDDKKALISFNDNAILNILCA